MRDGDQIPTFSAPASTGQTLSSESFAHKTPLVLFFLTSEEASQQEFSVVNERLSEFGAMRVQALGIAKVTAADARQMTQDRGWKAPVIADASGAIRRSFGVETYDATVVIADSDGTVRHVDDGAADAERPATVLDLLHSMRDDGRLAETVRS